MSELSNSDLIGSASEDKPDMSEQLYGYEQIN